MRRRFKLLAPVFAVLLALAIGFSGKAEPEKRVLAILSSGDRPYSEHLEGFRTGFQGQVEVKLLDSNSTTIKQSLKDRPPDLILAIGSSAAEFAAKNSRGIPVLFTMVYYPERHGLVGKPNVAGISLRVPPEKTLEALETIKPVSLKTLRVGLLYSSGKDEKEIESIRAALSEKGHVLDARRVDSQKDVGRELNELLPEIDALWLVADPTVLPNPEFLKTILARALDEKVAVIGLSDAHVRTGALLAVSVDWRLEGQAAAKAAGRILAGEDAGKIGVLPPQGLIWSLNRNVAQELDWPVTRVMSRQFEKVYP